jgi:hypothetical protein
LSVEEDELELTKQLGLKWAKPVALVNLAPGKADSTRETEIVCVRSL